MYHFTSNNCRAARHGHIKGTPAFLLFLPPLWRALIRLPELSVLLIITIHLVWLLQLITRTFLQKHMPFFVYRAIVHPWQECSEETILR